MFQYTKAEMIVMIPSLILMIGIAILLRFLLKDKSEKVKSIPFIVITIVLWAGEIAKQIVAFNNPKGYDFWAIPLHFCSTYFIWFTLAEFTRGKLRARMQSITFVMTLYLWPALYSSPGMILSNHCENLFVTFPATHSVLFHLLVILYSLCAMSLGRFHPTKRDCIVFPICIAVYFAIACTCAHLLQTNYFNLLTSTIPFLENLRVSAGQVVYTIVFATIMLSAGTLFLFACLAIKEKLKKADEEEEGVEDALSEDQPQEAV